MKVLKLTGRERAVIKAIDETAGSTGAEILESSHLDETDLPDVLNGLITSGYLEAFAPGSTLPMMDDVPLELVQTTRFELNPAFISQIRQATRRL